MPALCGYSPPILPLEARVRSVNIRYMPSVDHLRAFAAVLIVLYHGLHLFSYQARFQRPFDVDAWLQPRNPVLAFLAEGHTAVALFMVLSGFILTRGALDAEVSVLRFLRNRLLRTYPLFLLLVAAGVAASPQFQWSALLQTLSGFANLPGALVAPPFTSLLWTIAIEWQFYVLFPLLVAVLKPAWTRQMLGLLAVLLLFRGFAVLAGGNARDLAYLTLLGRLDQFLLGMWAAWFLQAHALSPRKGAWLAAASVSAMVLALWAFNAAGGWPLVAAWKLAWPTLEGALWTAFILGYVAFADRFHGRFSRALAAIGVVSYSLYLTHFLVIHAFLHLGWVPVLTGDAVCDALLITVGLALPAALALSALTYRFVERPFLRLRGRYHRPAAH